jgi:hypothetical protein
VVFGALGLAVSYLIAPPPGAGHHRPSGSAPSDCHYPPNQTSWSILWTIGGLIAGLAIGWVDRAGLSRRTRSGR